jgi:hypothetical protein
MEQDGARAEYVVTVLKREGEKGEHGKEGGNDRPQQSKDTR